MPLPRNLIRTRDAETALKPDFSILYTVIQDIAVHGTND